MAQQTINVGTAPNDGTGTPLRTAFQYTNSNFSELYTALGGGSGLPGAANQIIFNNGSSLVGNANLTFNTALNKLVANNIETAANLLVGTSATISGDLTVKTNVLKVDTTNNRVGIGTASPTAAFDILGAFGTSTAAAVIRNNSASSASNISQIQFFCANSFGGLEQVASMHGLNPNASANNGGALVFSTSLNGTGTTPAERYRIGNDGTATWSVGGSTAMTLNSTGLGVGTTPSYKLHVFGASPALTIQDSSSAAGGVGGTMNFISYTSGTSGANIEAQIKGVKSSASSAGELLFFTSDSSGTSQQRFMVDGTGNVGIGVTPSAGKGCLQLSSGINFPATQVASSDANTLDDYKESTWTPTITAGTGTPTTVTVNSANYTKIGRIVVINIDFTIVAIGTAAGALTFTLPFNHSGSSIPCGAFRENVSTGNMGQIYYGSGTTASCLMYNNATPWVNGYRIQGTYTYFSA